MKLEIGQEVLLARNYTDTARPGVLVRDIGTFYIGTTPPSNVNTVTGVIEPYRRDASFQIYDLFMNFNKAELMSCTNEIKSTTHYQDIANNLDISNTITFRTVEAAVEAEEVLKKNNIFCKRVGKQLIDILNVENAKGILEKASKPKKRSLFRRPTKEFDSELMVTNDEDHNFEL